MNTFSQLGSSIHKWSYPVSSSQKSFTSTTSGILLSERTKAAYQAVFHPVLVVFLGGHSTVLPSLTSLGLCYNSDVTTIASYYMTLPQNSWSQLHSEIVEQISITPSFLNLSCPQSLYFVDNTDKFCWQLGL